jgi:hypothetical protein
VDAAILVAIIGGAFGTWGAIIAARASRRATDSTERTTERSADLEWAKEIRQDAIDARKEVEALQVQLRTVSRQMETVQREAEYWISQYQLVHRTAWRPGMTLDRLRQFIGPDAPTTPAAQS